MKKSLKALAVLSLFGLGLGSVTACGGSSKSITISVNGTAVGNGESVNVTETSIFTLNATVDNGSEDDVVVWSTNSPSAITFSSHSGAEITATANTPTTTGWVVAATLESDSTVTTATLGVTYAQQGEVNLQNIVPGALSNNEFIFSVTNSSQVTTAYTLVWDVTKVDFAGQPSAKDLKYEVLKCTDGQSCTETSSLQAATALPTTTGETAIPSAQAETVGSLATNYYKVRITFEDTGVAQNDMQGKNFAGLIKVGAAAQDVDSLS